MNRTYEEWLKYYENATKEQVIEDMMLDIKEIKRLKELCDKYEEEHSTTFEYWKRLIKEDYKSRCEKAAQYINNLEKDYDINVWQEDKHWAYVLYILTGDDKNE